MLVNVKVTGEGGYDLFVETRERDNALVIERCAEKGVFRDMDDKDWAVVDRSPFPRALVEKHFTIHDID